MLQRLERSKGFSDYSLEFKKPTEAQITGVFRAIHDELSRAGAFIYGSAGRRINNRINWNTHKKEDVEQINGVKFRKDDRGIIDIDITADESKITWDKLTEFSRRMFLENKGLILVDPHLFRITNFPSGEQNMNLQKPTPQLDIPNNLFPRVSVVYNGIPIDTLHPKGDLLMRLAFGRIRKKDIPDILLTLKQYHASLNSTQTNENKYYWQLLSNYVRNNPHLLTYDLFRIIYHILPQDIRSLIRLRERIGINQERNVPIYSFDSPEEIYI